MRVLGWLKLILVLVVDFFLINGLLGPELALVITAGLLLYAGWLGEWLGLLQDGAIRLEKLGSMEQSRLLEARASLAEEVQRTCRADLSCVRFYVIPSHEINAFSYGSKIGITRAALQACDDGTLLAVLGHEASHHLHGDAPFHRLLFANATLLLAGLSIGSFVAISFLWILFLILCAAGVCGGLCSAFLFRGTNSLIKGFFTGLQHVLVFIYQSFMGLVSRRCEYRADRFSCQLGYATQLEYFLSRFVQEQDESRRRSLSELLYSSHPATEKRLARIEQAMEQGRLTVQK